MTVENQFPYQSFTANGLQTNFALGFYVDDKDHFEVSKNDQAVSKNDYSYDKGSNSIFFNTPPKTGEQIEVTRRTASERGITYSTYNNTFRPETLNKDLDRIWLKLQELGVVDQLQKLYTQTLHNQQQHYIEQKDEILQSNINALEAYTKSEDTKLQTNINNVKSYSDTQNATLKNELLRIFADHDVHFNSLDSLTSYILNRLSLLET